jgi:hypothetical protein
LPSSHEPFSKPDDVSLSHRMGKLTKAGDGKQPLDAQLPSWVINCHGG